MLNLPLKNCSNWQITFLIKFDDPYFKDHPQDSPPTPFFKGFRSDELIRSTGDTVLWNEKGGDTEVVIEVAHSPEEDPKPTKLVKNLMVKELNTQIRPLVIPDAATKRLEKKEIKTLKDIRRKGGIPRFEDVPP